MDHDVLRSAHPETVVVAAGRGPRAPGSPLNVPLVPASAFQAPAEVEYAREGNPTWAALEEAVGALEGGTAVAYASGIAAVAAVLRRVPVGGTVVAPRDAYTGFRALVADLEGQGRLRVRPVAIDDTGEVLAACEGADLLWVETPTNPLLHVADLPALVGGAHRLDLPVAVDNTFATPLRQRPLEHGADVTVHSATKLIGGHSDLLLGIAVTRDGGWHAHLHGARANDGATPGVLEAWLALRGVRSLAVRIDRAEANARELAARLGRHPAVARVRYPAFGTVVSFELAGGREAGDALCARAGLIVHATSLGGVETTMERRGRQPGEEAVPEGLIRLSVGCEHVDDLWADLARGLDGVS